MTLAVGLPAPWPAFTSMRMLAAIGSRLTGANPLSSTTSGGEGWGEEEILSIRVETIRHDAPEETTRKDIVRLKRFPLSPALSPLLRRGARESTPRPLKPSRGH